MQEEMFSMTAIILSFTWPVYNDELVVYLSNYGTTGITWTEQGAGQYSPVAPSLAALNGRLYMAFRSNDPTNRLLVMSSSDNGGHWTGGQLANLTTVVAPALAVGPGPNGELLYLAFTQPPQEGGDASSIEVVATDGVEWTEPLYTQATYQALTPALGAF
jgi:hypothetical protein